MTFGSNGHDDIFGDQGLLTGSSNSALQTSFFQSQFFHFEQFYLPKTVKELFRYSAHIFLTHDSINPALEKLSEYPITDFTFAPIIRSKTGTAEYSEEYKSKFKITEAWQNLFDHHLMAKGFAIKISTNYYVYGNAFVSVYQPFDRVLICGQCGENHLLTKVKWEWDRGKMAFNLKCPKCKFKGIAQVKDLLVKDPKRINLISYYPGNVDIDYCPYSGEKEYYYTIPEEEADKIRKGNRMRLEKTPWGIIEAVKAFRAKRAGVPKIKLPNNNIFHLVRHTIDMPGSENPWGMPITVSVIRSIFYLNIMKRAQTALLMDHILPFRYLYPGTDTGSNTSLPIDLSDWRKRMQIELKKHKKDPLYIMLSPIPLGKDQMGGDGKALMLFPEMQMVQDNIINGINVPMEFVKGGMQYAGSNVSLRMLENTLLNQIEQVVKCFKWITKRVSQISGMENVETDMRKFKMADDVQQKQMMSQLWQLGAISGDLLGQWNDFDYAKEAKKRTAENLDKAVSDAKAQAEAANKMQVLQSLMQFTLAPEMSITPPPMDPGMVDQVYQGLGKMVPEQSQAAIQQIGTSNPAMARELGARASTDVNSYGSMMQTMLAMNPAQQQSAFGQMQQTNPTQALILSNLMKAFNMEGMDQSQGGQPGQGGVTKENPDQKPAARNRSGAGSAM